MLSRRSPRKRHSPVDSAGLRCDNKPSPWTRRQSLLDGAWRAIALARASRSVEEMLQLAMQTDRVRAILDSPAEADQWLRGLGFSDTRTAQANLVRLATAGVPLDLLGTLCE